MTALGFIGHMTEAEDKSGGGFSFEWRIPDFLTLAAESDDFYSSPSFGSFGGDWFLCVYPNGIPHFTPSGWVSLFLYHADAGPPETLSVTLGIRGSEGRLENKRERWEEFSEEDRVCCWFDVCSRRELEDQKSRLMPGGELTFVLDIRRDLDKESSTQEVEESEEAEVVIEEIQTSEKQGMEELRKSLQGLLAGGEDSDVLIRVRGEDFPAHRAILRARSPVLQTMFTHDMVEEQSGVVTMEDCDPESFPSFLEHIYTGSIGMISIGNVFSLYSAAEKYDLGVLKEACGDFVKSNLTVNCICNAIRLSLKHDEEELLEIATEYFSSNALEIMITNEWVIFLKENTAVGNELLIKALQSKEEK